MKYRIVIFCVFIAIEYCIFACIKQIRVRFLFLCT